MMEILIDQLPVWTTAITQKSKGRLKGIDNQHIYGIQKLRELILDLAIRGKLVPQDPNDEPASELLKKIASEKQKLYKEGAIKRQTLLPEVTEEEKPFDLPGRWVFERLGCYLENITDGTHFSPPTETFGHPYVTVSDLDWDGNIDLKFCKRISKESYEELVKGGCKPKFNDVLFSKDGTVGKTYVVKEYDDFVILSSLAILRPVPQTLNPYFFEVLLKSPAILQQAIDKKTGSALRRIVLAKLKELIIPIPPLNEQKRIVSKVDELMALCDELEKEQETHNKTHYLLVKSLLESLTNAGNPQEFQSTWLLISAQFENLFTTEESIDLLKQNILQLAVMGKLVPQDPKDEPASELLKKIAAEKQKLIKEGKIKKQAALSEVSEEEEPFELPEGWEWTRWDHISLKIGDIDHKMPIEVKKGYPYISPRDFLPNNKIDFERAKKISDEDFRLLSSKIQPQKGDIIYPRYGTIGENRLVDTDIDFLASYSCCVIKTLHGFVNPDYQFIYSISSFVKQQASQAENKTTQANVGIKSIQSFIVPFPPLNEQNRIVSKVEELFGICDELKGKIIKLEEIKVWLADGVGEITL